MDRTKDALEVWLEEETEHGARQYAYGPDHEAEIVKAIAYLPGTELVKVLSACTGCGCCVSGPWSSVRQAVMTEVRRRVSGRPEEFVTENERRGIEARRAQATPAPYSAEAEASWADKTGR